MSWAERDVLGITQTRAAYARPESNPSARVSSSVHGKKRGSVTLVGGGQIWPSQSAGCIGARSARLDEEQLVPAARCMLRDEAPLLRAWKDGDREAARALFERHVGVVSRFFWSKLGPEADDLVQLTFMTAFTAPHRFEGRSSFRSYLLGVANKLLLKHLRSRYKRGRQLDFDEVTLRDLGTSVSRKVARDDERQRLLESLASLPLHEQVALELYYWEGLPASEIAEALGVPEGTIRTRIRSARMKLRRSLGAVRSVGMGASSSPNPSGS